MKPSTRTMLALLALAACQAPAAPADPFAHDKLFAVAWMRESAEFAACCRQAFAAATRTLEAARADAAFAALPVVAPAGARLAVITDLDETILDNVGYQAHLVTDGVDFSETTWTQWVQSGRVGLLPGAREFLAHATTVADVFYVSNRTAPDHAAATIAALAEADPKLASEPHRLLLQAKGASSDKQARRDLVAKTHRVVLLLGDDLGDFVSVPKVDAKNAVDDVVARRRTLVDAAAAKWGTAWIVLPNPSYGSWARLLGPDPAAAHRARLARLQRDGWSPPR